MLFLYIGACNVCIESCRPPFERLLKVIDLESKPLNITTTSIRNYSNMLVYSPLHQMTGL